MELYSILEQSIVSLVDPFHGPVQYCMSKTTAALLRTTRSYYSREYLCHSCKKIDEMIVAEVMPRTRVTRFRGDMARLFSNLRRRAISSEIRAIHNHDLKRYLSRENKPSLTPQRSFLCKRELEPS